MIFFAAKLEANHNLPEPRKQEADRKRRVLKDQLELSIAFEKLNSEPLNQVLYHINSEGRKYLGKAMDRHMNDGRRTHQSRRIDTIFFDCGDDPSC